MQRPCSFQPFREMASGWNPFWWLLLLSEVSILALGHAIADSHSTSTCHLSGDCLSIVSPRKGNQTIFAESIKFNDSLVMEESKGEHFWQTERVLNLFEVTSHEEDAPVKRETESFYEPIQDSGEATASVERVATLPSRPSQPEPKIASPETYGEAEAVAKLPVATATTTSESEAMATIARIPEKEVVKESPSVQLVETSSPDLEAKIAPAFEPAMEPEPMVSPSIPPPQEQSAIPSTEPSHSSEAPGVSRLAPESEISFPEVMDRPLLIPESESSILEELEEPVSVPEPEIYSEGLEEQGFAPESQIASLESIESSSTALDSEISDREQLDESMNEPEISFEDLEEFASIPDSEMAPLEDSEDSVSAPNAESIDVSDLEEEMLEVPSSEAEDDPQRLLPETISAEQSAIEPEPSEFESLPPISMEFYFLHMTNFRECPQICSQDGISYKERYITCHNNAGIPVPIEKCSNLVNFDTLSFEKCDVFNCGPNVFLLLSEWSSCPNRCAKVNADGTLVPNKATRSYTCRSGRTGIIVEQTKCSRLIERHNIALEMECNSVPCHRYWYKASEWDSCDCTTWTRRRTVTCVDWKTGEAVDRQICENLNLEPPKAIQVCFPEHCYTNPVVSYRKILQSDLGICDLTDCSVRGECVNGRCFCEEGFEGPDCQIDVREQPECPPPSILDEHASCCLSGIFDLNGVCCDGLNGLCDINVDGDCCHGKPLDPCGNCSGDTQVFIDAAGQCCEVLDASGTCCHSGMVDECGICDGLGTSCDTQVKFHRLPQNGYESDSCIEALRSVVADIFAEKAITLTFLNKRYFVYSHTNVALTTGFINWKIRQEIARRELVERCSISDVTIKKQPVCGNGYCEIEEYKTCPEDCDFTMDLCEFNEGLFDQEVMCNSHGRCSFANTSFCDCYAGYEGENCEICSPGFFGVSDSRCIVQQPFLNKPDPPSLPTKLPPAPQLENPPIVSPMFEPKIAPTSSSHGEKKRNYRNLWVWWPVFLYILLCFICCFVFALGRRKEEEEEESQDMTTSDRSSSERPLLRFYSGSYDDRGSSELIAIPQSPRKRYTRFSSTQF